MKKVTNWTPEQIKALDLAHDDHHQNCDECLAEETPEPDDHMHCDENPDEACYLDDYCSAGKETFKAWLGAIMEYREQPNYDPTADYGYDDALIWLSCPADAANSYLTYMSEHDIGFREEETDDDNERCFVIDKKHDPHQWELDLDAPNLEL